jgi:3-phosphoshikimate 1-carboxyvinyltransferase
MERIVEPLQMMGVPVTSADGGTAPLVFDGRAPGAKLRSANITLSVASAQVKSCLLLAGLAADGPSRLFEPGPSRDHTERMLASQGVDVLRKEIGQGGCEGVETTLVPLQKPLLPLRMTLPGDFSAAAFLITAAAITPGSDVLLPGVGLNPTRTGLLDALRAMGAEIDVTDPGEQGGEPVGDLHVRAARMNGGIVQGDAVVRMIDEFPVFGAAAALAAGRTVVRDAVELRYKETDRIATLCGALSDLGVPAEEAPDGFTVTGGDVPGGETHGRGDHRLAMAMAVMGLAAKNPVVVHGAEIMHESYPGFVDALHRLGAQVTMETRP